MRSSALLLIAVNLLPVAGVLYFDWSVLHILLLYWTESVVIGVVNVLRMLVSTTAPRGQSSEPLNRPTRDHPKKWFLIPFFALHYGAFCYAHLSALGLMFTDVQTHLSFPASLSSPGVAFWIGVTAIFVSHLFSYLVNYIGQGEHRRVGIAELMPRPYGRIFVLQITIIAGGALVEYLQNPLWMLFVLIAAKTAFDLKLHLAERDKFDAAPAASI